MKKKAFKRIISICVIVFLFGSLLLPVAASSYTPPTGNIPYEDVPRGRWDHEYVSWAWVNNITTGTSQTTFSPTDNVTRAQFATFIHRVAGTPPSSPTTFTDRGTIPHWAVDAVGWASRVGVTTGFLDNNTFRPNNNITREQIITMLFRYIGDLGHNVTAPTTALNGFLAADRGSVSSWALTAMRWGAHNGIIGTGGTLNPLGNATRSESMAMIKRVVDIYGLDLQLWSRPFLDVPALPPNNIAIPRMTPAAIISATLTEGAPFFSEVFYIDTAGEHRFVLTELAQDGRKVEFKVLRESSYGSGVFVDMPGFPAFIPIGYREGPGFDFSVGRYLVQVRPNMGALGYFELSVLRDKQITNISTPSRNDINIKYISDFMQFERQHNEYRFQTPTTTRTGLPIPSGIYRFGITSVPSEFHIRSTIRLEVFLERTLEPVVAAVDLALFEAVNAVLRDNETYIIRTTQIPIAGGTVGTVMSDETPYVLQVSAQKERTIITPTSTDEASRTLRRSVVNDSFQFIGQMNTYEFTAPANGTYQFRPNLMPGTSQSEFRISDPWGEVVSQTIGVGEGISKNLVATVTYRLHVIHQPGSPIGNYSFTIVYP